jgi:hypothetical protein
LQLVGSKGESLAYAQEVGPADTSAKVIGLAEGVDDVHVLDSKRSGWRLVASIYGTGTVVLAHAVEKALAFKRKAILRVRLGFRGEVVGKLVQRHRPSEAKSVGVPVKGGEE